MKKILITIACIFLCLEANIGVGAKVPIRETVVIKPLPTCSEELYPLYDSGRVIDSAAIKQVGKVKIIVDYYPAVCKMIDAACRDGVVLYVNSGYRTFEEQLSYRKKNARSKRKKNDMEFLLHACSDEFFPETGRPGYSRHQRGIAFDFNTRNKEVYKWLKKNALQYGFVRTVEEEKWHWEYLPSVTNQYVYVCEDSKTWK